MKLMRTEDAVGQVLCHDITRIIKGVSKGPVFRKGHVIVPEDIPVLKSVGKEHIYIWEKDKMNTEKDGQDDSVPSPFSASQRCAIHHSVQSKLLGLHCRRLSRFRPLRHPATDS